MARRRMQINRGAASIFVQFNGKTVTLDTLPPTDRAKAIQQILTVPGLVIPAAPAPQRPAVASPSEDIPGSNPQTVDTFVKPPTRSRAAKPAAKSRKKK